MKKSAVEKRMQEQLHERITTDSFRQLIPSDPSFHDFSSNDYLGLTRSPFFHDYVRARVYETGDVKLFGSGGSRLLSGNDRRTEAAERFFAQHFKADAGLIFNSGYAANCGIFSCIPKKGDTILYDELIHASVRDGMRMSHAKAWSFRHNDVAHLKELLARAEGAVFVAVEAVYSMDGDEAPLTELAALCSATGASLIVDEAHSTGLYGGNGEGLCVEKGVHNKVFIRLYTFGKAMGCHGAFVAGAALLKDYLVNFSRPFIYTTALPFHDVFVMRTAVSYVCGHAELRKQLFGNVHYFREKAAAAGLPLLHSDSAIQGMKAPGNERAKAIMKQCFAQQFDVRAILHPTVAPGSERLRIILHSFNTAAEIDGLVNILANA